MSYPERIRVILLRESGRWVAQCWDYDLAAQADTWSDTLRDLEGVVDERIKVCENRGVDPFALSPAPKRYWDRFESAPSWKVDE